jgi:hypothetical protein
MLMDHTERLIGSEFNEGDFADYACGIISDEEEWGTYLENEDHGRRPKKEDNLDFF